MTILVIDTFMERNTQLGLTVSEAFQDDLIITMTDPMYAVQYCMQHKVDIAFIDMKTWPIDGVEVSSLIRKFNKNAKTYLIVDMKGYFIKTNNVITDLIERPVTEGKIRELVGVIRGEGKTVVTPRRFSLTSKLSAAYKSKRSSSGAKRRSKG